MAKEKKTCLEAKCRYLMPVPDEICMSGFVCNIYGFNAPLMTCKRYAGPIEGA